MPLPRPTLVVLPLALIAGLAACSSDGVAPASTGVGQFLRGTTQEPTTIDPAITAAEIRCPEVTILPGTESIRRDDGTGDNAALRWQASISRTARECTRAEGEAITVRIGLAGRVIEGSRGAPEQVELPVRIAVREGEDVTYSRLHNVQVAMGQPSQDWAYVEENVRIEAPGSAVIVVGFDG
jgi:hypothetical protein